MNKETLYIALVIPLLLFVMNRILKFFNHKRNKKIENYFTSKGFNFEENPSQTFCKKDFGPNEELISKSPLNIINLSKKGNTEFFEYSYKEIGQKNPSEYINLVKTYKTKIPLFRLSRERFYHKI